MRDELISFFTALRFLSRLPVPLADAPEGAMQRALRYYPLAGAVIGLSGGIVYMVAATILPPLVAAALALAVHLLVTGALHEDGLADTADGLGGGATKARALEIMRDSRTGVYGAAAIVLSLILRTAALAAFAPLAGFFAWIAVQTIGRLAILPALALTDYARAEGLASAVSGRPTPADLAVACATGIAVVVVATGAAGIVAIIVAAAAAGLMLWRLVARLGGYTGDGLGAVEQIAEIAALVALAAVI